MHCCALKELSPPLTICKAFIGGLCSEALPHQQLAVCVCHPVALVTFHHTDGDQAEGHAQKRCSRLPGGSCFVVKVLLPKAVTSSENASVPARQFPHGTQAHTLTSVLGEGQILRVGQSNLGQLSALQFDWTITGASQPSV